MPLYVGDYLADTQHLSATEHGAYLLLLMHYWQHGKLPAEDETLCRIARVHPPHWSRIRRALEPFFSHPKTGGAWVSKRLDLEITKAAEISNKRKDAALQKHSKSKANAVQLHTQSQSQSPKEDKIREAPPASVFTEGSKALADALWRGLGITHKLQIPPEVMGADWRALEWEKSGWTADLVESETRRVGPGKPLTYYEKVFATAFAKRQAPLPVVEIREAEKLTVTKHGTSSDKSLIAALNRKLAEVEAADGPDLALPESNILRLSDGSVR